MGSKYARIAGIIAGRPARNYKQPLWSGHNEKVYHTNIYFMEEFELWLFFRAQ